MHGSQRQDAMEPFKEKRACRLSLNSVTLKTHNLLIMRVLNLAAHAIALGLEALVIGDRGSEAGANVSQVTR